MGYLFGLPPSAPPSSSEATDVRHVGPPTQAEDEARKAAEKAAKSSSKKKKKNKKSKSKTADREEL